MMNSTSVRAATAALVLTAVLSGSASSQSTGTLSISTGLVTKDLEVRPIPNLALELVSSTDTFVRYGFRTDLNGVARTPVPLGTYFLRNTSPVEFQGNRYRWYLTVRLNSTFLAVELSGANAVVENAQASAPVAVKVEDHPAAPKDSAPRPIPDNSSQQSAPVSEAIVNWTTRRVVRTSELIGRAARLESLRGGLKFSIRHSCIDPKATATGALKTLGFEIQSVGTSSIVTAKRAGPNRTQSAPPASQLQGPMGDRWTSAMKSNLEAYNRMLAAAPEYVAKSEATARFTLDFSPVRNSTEGYNYGVTVWSQTETRGAPIPLPADFRNDLARLWLPDMIHLIDVVVTACN